MYYVSIVKIIMMLLFVNPAICFSYLDSTTTEPTTTTAHIVPTTTEGKRQISLSYSHGIGNVLSSCSPYQSLILFIACRTFWILKSYYT